MSECCGVKRVRRAVELSRMLPETSCSFFLKSPWLLSNASCGLGACSQLSLELLDKWFAAYDGKISPDVAGVLGFKAIAGYPDVYHGLPIFRSVSSVSAWRFFLLVTRASAALPEPTCRLMSVCIGSFRRPWRALWRKHLAGTRILMQRRWSLRQEQPRPLKFWLFAWLNLGMPS